MIRKVIFYSSFLVGCLLIRDLGALLDGLTQRIHLDARYTFTDGELARGSVYFRNGFDLPTGGTVYLGIDSGFISSTVNLNGGTIMLQTPVQFVGDGCLAGKGFIKGLSSYGQLILHAKLSPGLWVGGDSDTLTFLSPMTIRSTTYSARFGATLASQKIDLTQVNGPFTFESGEVILLGSTLLTTTAFPSSLRFVSCLISQTDDDTIINSSQVAFAGRTTLKTSSLLSLNFLTVEPNARVTIYPGSYIFLNGLDIIGEATQLELKNTLLDFMSTTSNDIKIGFPSSVQGHIGVEGRCVFQSSTGNILDFQAPLSLDFLANARLIIDGGNHIRIR